MHRRVARGNRLVLAAVGLVLLIAGLALIAVNRGRFGTAGRHSVLYPAAARRFVRDQHEWLWPVIAVAAVLVGLLFLRWLVRQFRADTLRRLRIDSDGDGAADGSAGRTSLPATVFTNAVKADLENVRGVRRVSAALSGAPDAPELWLTVTTEADADLPRVRRHLTQTTRSEAKQALELDELPLYVQLRLSRRAERSRPAQLPASGSAPEPS